VRKNWILKNGKPIPAESILQWASWYETADRTVARTDISEHVDVSTVFLSIDHNFTGKGPPVLWETLIRGGPRDGWMDRYTSESDAKKGHKRACALAKGEIADINDAEFPPATARPSRRRRRSS
jgi:hypothetical protein